MKQDSTMRYVKQQIWKQRIGYGVSDFACNLIWQMISLYLLYFYTDVMSLSAKSIAFMFVVTRSIDGGTDLLSGGSPGLIFSSEPYHLHCLPSLPSVYPTFPSQASLSMLM